MSKIADISAFVDQHNPQCMTKAQYENHLKLTGGNSVNWPANHSRRKAIVDRPVITPEITKRLVESQVPVED